VRARELAVEVLAWLIATMPLVCDRVIVEYLWFPRFSSPRVPPAVHTHTFTPSPLTPKPTTPLS
jgi:hypothetical protein